MPMSCAHRHTQWVGGTAGGGFHLERGRCAYENNPEILKRTPNFGKKCSSLQFQVKPLAALYDLSKSTYLLKL